MLLSRRLTHDSFSTQIAAGDEGFPMTASPWLIAMEEPGAETLRVPVTDVFDGDGFKSCVWSTRKNRQLELSVRFGFIDAPEMGQPGGQEAKDRLQSLIAGQWLELAIL